MACTNPRNLPVDIHISEHTDSIARLDDCRSECVVSRRTHSFQAKQVSGRHQRLDLLSELEG